MENKSGKMVLELSVNILLVLLGAFVIFMAANKAYTFGYNIFNEQAVTSKQDAIEIEVKIPNSVSAKELSKILYDKGLVADKEIFYFQIIFSDYKEKIVPGTYKLSTDMTPTVILQKISASNSEGDLSGK